MQAAPQTDGRRSRRLSLLDLPNETLGLVLGHALAQGPASDAAGSSGLVRDGDKEEPMAPLKKSALDGTEAVAHPYLPLLCRLVGSLEAVPEKARLVKRAERCYSGPLEVRRLQSYYRHNMQLRVAYVLLLNWTRVCRRFQALVPWEALYEGVLLHLKHSTKCAPSLCRTLLPPPKSSPPRNGRTLFRQFAWCAAQLGRETPPMVKELWVCLYRRWARLTVARLVRPPWLDPSNNLAFYTPQSHPHFFTPLTYDQLPGPFLKLADAMRFPKPPAQFNFYRICGSQNARLSDLELVPLYQHEIKPEEFTDPKSQLAFFPIDDEDDHSGGGLGGSMQMAPDFLCARMRRQIIMQRRMRHEASTLDHQLADVGHTIAIFVAWEKCQKAPQVAGAGTQTPFPPPCPMCGEPSHVGSEYMRLVMRCCYGEDNDAPAGQERNPHVPYPLAAPQWAYAMATEWRGSARGYAGASTPSIRDPGAFLRHLHYLGHLNLQTPCNTDSDGRPPIDLNRQKRDRERPLVVSRRQRHSKRKRGPNE